MYGVGVAEERRKNGVFHRKNEKHLQINREKNEPQNMGIRLTLISKKV